MKTEIENIEPLLKKVLELASSHKVGTIEEFPSKTPTIPLVNCEGDTEEKLRLFIGRAIKH